MASRAGAGIVSGLVGGFLSGVLLSLMQTPSPNGDQPSMLRLVGHAVHSDSLLVSWVVYLAVSAAIGAVFALVVGEWSRRDGVAVALGLGVGLAAWAIGWLVVMPMLLGRPIDAPLLDVHLMPLVTGSFLGCVGFGAILGGGVAWLADGR